MKTNDCNEDARAGSAPVSLLAELVADGARVLRDRLPPHSLEAEQAVLSCILLAPQDVLPLCLERFAGREAFYDLRHRAIYAALETLYDQRHPIDLITLAQRLKDQQQWEAVGGMAFLAPLPDVAPSSAHAGYYIDIVWDKYLLRRLLRACTSITGRIYEHAGHAEELLDGAESEILQVGEQRGTSAARPIRTLVNVALDSIEQAHARGGALTGLATGFPDFDQLTSGLHAGEMIVIAARPSLGKAQPLNVSVLTPEGYVAMSQIAVGSMVIGADGRPHPVVGVFPQGQKKVSKVIFSDGTFTRCCDEHLWFTQTRNERRRGVLGSVKTTAEIHRTIRRPDGAYRNHVVPAVRPVEFAQGDGLPLHPWLCGALLGDGSLANGCVVFSKPEADLHRKLMGLLPPDDTAVVADEMSLRIKRRQRDNDRSETMTAIERLGLNVRSERKFIPGSYLHASIPNRLELLRGLLDTDGCVGGTSIEFSTSSERLMADVKYLVRSLGGICVEGPSRIPTYTHRGARKIGLVNYRCQIWFEDPSVVPVTSAKHLSKLRLDARHVHKSIVEIHPDGNDECQCLLLDSADHLYVTDDFIVTHNTALAMNIAEHVALDLKLPVGVFSLEMTAESLVLRMMASRARVNLRNLRQGFLTERDFPKLTGAAGQLAVSPLFIDDSSDLTIMQLRAKARRLWQQHGLKLLIVDYLQLLRGSSPKTENRQQEVAEISRGLKSLAKELNTPVLVLSQLNRDLEREGRPPRLSDLRESGALEQDSDVVGLLYRPKADDTEEVQAGVPEREAAPVQLALAKQRNGPTGDVALTFLRSYTRFESVARSQPACAPDPRYKDP